MTERRLIELVGEQKAQQLIEEWGGHDLPRRTQAAINRRDRDARLRQFVDTTGSTARAAAEFGVSERHVKRIANGA